MKNKIIREKIYWIPLLKTKTKKNVTNTFHRHCAEKAKKSKLPQRTVLPSGFSVRPFQLV